jgi:methylthioribose-1-phosphate isomerase
MAMAQNPNRPIWLHESNRSIQVIDQRLLPHELKILTLSTVDDVVYAICEMVVRGAPLIGVTAAYGVYLAGLSAPENGYASYFEAACQKIKAARPTAVNLAWAVDRVSAAAASASSVETLRRLALAEADAICRMEVDNCRRIGRYGLELIRRIAEKKNGEPVRILTHCNAGWLACVEYGTATAPIYAAHEAGIPIHVWVDETRPLNQGARLTAWELGRAGIPHTVITDNAGGHLMQHRMVDAVMVGTDRTTHTGDVANKIGTYLKALAARDNGIPFYVALPSSTFDWTLEDGVQQIPIEERNPEEVTLVQGLHDGKIFSVRVPPETSPAANYAFDVTPARLVTGFITERGVCNATKESILSLFPDKISKNSN